MLGIEIIAVGSVRTSWTAEGIDHYRKLLSKYADIKIVTIKEGDSAHFPVDKVIAADSTRISEKLAPRAMHIVLDSDGRQFSSTELARFFDHSKQKYSAVQFVIGGAFGIESEFKKSFDLALSLSPMTFPHELTQLLLLEQLYRASSILAGSKYHK
jgi:23S rRNA (pseudouridine1915-N3)-methyltransferase